MNKQDAAWLIVRGCGLFVIAGAIWHFGSVVYMVGVLVNALPSKAHMSDLSVWTALYGSIVCVLMVALGVYLLKGGAKIHALLMR